MVARTVVPDVVVPAGAPSATVVLAPAATVTEAGVTVSMPAASSTAIVRVLAEPLVTVRAAGDAPGRTTGEAMANCTSSPAPIVSVLFATSTSTEPSKPVVDTVRSYQPGAKSLVPVVQLRPLRP